MAIFVCDSAFLMYMYLQYDTVDDMDEESVLCPDVMVLQKKSIGWMRGISMTCLVWIGYFHIIRLIFATRNIIDIINDQNVAGEQGEVYRHYSWMARKFYSVLITVIFLFLTALIFRASFLSINSSEYREKEDHQLNIGIMVIVIALVFLVVYFRFIHHARKFAMDDISEEIWVWKVVTFLFVTAYLFDGLVSIANFLIFEYSYALQIIYLVFNVSYSNLVLFYLVVIHLKEYLEIYNRHFLYYTEVHANTRIRAIN